ncbi:lytic transglycosylase domain-containing protein [Halobacteriovorax sp. HLS]|uniref:lytic transglycosylase domain-containing protein n=1 Tax=Halobacteriovorax sp. HLS TaxID=2234000 RepID=UPI000FDA3BA6|nr:lytic transglycosylase domain-containing protein [Halobacteriovorax sp. HLS]
MLRILTTLILLSFSITSNAAKKTNLDFSLNTNKYDTRFSKSFYQFYKGIKKNKFDRVAVRLMKNNFKKSTAFKEYAPLMDELNLFYKNRKLRAETFHKVCLPKSKGQSDNPDLVKRTFKYLENYCRSQFLKNVTNAKENSSITFKNLTYLKFALPYYLKGQHKKDFIRYLSRINPQSEFHKLISELMTEEYLENKFKPNSGHLKYIKISTELTNYVQSAGLKDSSEKNYFTKEFYAIRSDFRKSVKTGDINLAYEKGQQLVTFFDSNKKYIDDKRAWISILTAGKSFLYKQDPEKARFFFEYALTIATNDQLDETIFQLLWSNILFGKFSKAVTTIEQFKLIKNYDKYNSKVKFWIAYTLYKNGEEELSKHLFTTLTESSPLNFYAIISYKKLLDIFDVEDKKKLLNKYSEENSPEIPRSNKYSPNFVASMKRLSLWLDQNYDSFSNNEISEIISRDSAYVFTSPSKKIDNKELRKHLVVKLVNMFTKEKKYLHSFKLVHQSLDKEHFELDAFTIRNLFPFQYLNKIEKIDSTIDPLVVLSLIRQESAFNPRAKSHVGARGLMQLMPATAKQYKKNVKTSHLKRPDVNIRIGINYLKRLLKMYDGNLIYTLSAYNAGESRVRRWRKDIFITEDPMVTIESIPFKETRKYVKLIYRNIFFYNLLSNKSVLEKSLEDSFYVSLNSKR